MTRRADALRRAESGILARAGAQFLHLLHWRRLIIDLARAELTRENARLVLGGLWWVADPLLQMAVYTVLVSVIFARTLPDYPIFVLAALIPWKGFSASVGAGGVAITGNERIVRQLMFPRIVLPVARVVAQLWRLAVALIVMVALMVVLWPDRVSPALVWLPVLAIIEVLFLLPFVIALSAATVFLRDLTNFMRHVMRLALYLSPVLYSVDQLVARVPEPIGEAYQLNPVAVLLEGFRDIAYHGIAPSASSLLLPLGVGLVLIGPALAWFGRVERSFGKAL